MHRQTDCGCGGQADGEFPRKVRARVGKMRVGAVRVGAVRVKVEGAAAVTSTWS